MVWLFRKLKPAAIKTVALQTRPFEVIELRDISLKPGHKTDAKLLSVPQTAAKAVWGKAINGVQIRVGAKQTKWNAGDVPEFFADVRNRGELNLWVYRTWLLCELEVDGEWYRPGVDVTSRPSSFPPSREYTEIQIPDARWHHKRTFDDRAALLFD